MQDKSVDAARLAEEVMASVREIVAMEGGRRIKLSKMRELTVRLGEAAARCQLGYDAAVQAGNKAKMNLLRKQHDLLDKAMQYVSDSALGFTSEPVYLTDPGWQR
jgi:hypothetical protein